MLAHDMMRHNRLLYPILEKELAALFSKMRIEDLFLYKHEVELLFAQYVGVSLCSFVDSGTTALYLACNLAGVKDGDEVALPILSWPSTVAAVVACKAVPRFFDIKQDCTINEELVLSATPMKVVVPVHMYGHAAAVHPFLLKQMLVIEDCCQAHGTKINEKMVGTFGQYSAFSFDPYKTISSVGTGGALLYRRKEEKEAIRSLLSIEKADPKVLSFHRTPGKMSYTDMAVLKAKLKCSPLIEKKKRQCMERYEQRLDGSSVQIIKDTREVNSIRQSYLVYVPKRDGVLSFLEQQSILCKKPYSPLSKIPLFAPYCRDQSFPQADRYTNEALILPLFPLMEPKEVDVVCDALLSFFR